MDKTCGETLECCNWTGWVFGVADLLQTLRGKEDSGATARLFADLKRVSDQHGCLARWRVAHNPPGFISTTKG